MQGLHSAFAMREVGTGQRGTNVLAEPRHFAIPRKTFLSHPHQDTAFRKDRMPPGAGATVLTGDGYATMGTHDEVMRNRSDNETRRGALFSRAHNDVIDGILFGEI